ncbi:MAG: TetR family transcriptional regulator [Ilumatobacteraceae bacterium]|mgnify:FL=1|nr:TetR family transcriptional regulator [Acidimicrobiaceae bacterium]MBP6489141.1 TetR family transcriptional regulator [Ilumatobacteraceae bacterium]MBP7890083.1 TetR family transcriptional regulator [Ilumatobacteraceae bacterium]MBP8210211.1 TetR family transcriptional regulator [Ilumatobacteraceae bacterium]HQZ35820.1 TetR/AcrR family transcriptional regulator [Ilumatobacteraceae bacterium]
MIAATELFAQHGYHAVGMRAIADAVGIRGSSLYHHFPSKTELLYAIAHDYNRAFIEGQLADLSPNPTHAARVRKLVYDHIIYFHEHRLEEAVGLRELQELRTNAPEHYTDIQTYRRSYQDAFERLIVEGRANGEFECDDPHLAVLAVLGMVNSVNDWYRDRGRMSIVEVADAYADITVNRILGAR